MPALDVPALVITVVAMGVGGAFLYWRSLSKRQSWKPDTTHDIHDIGSIPSRLMIDNPLEGRIFTTAKPDHPENARRDRRRDP